MSGLCVVHEEFLLSLLPCVICTSVLCVFQITWTTTSRALDNPTQIAGFYISNKVATIFEDSAVAAAHILISLVLSFWPALVVFVSLVFVADLPYSTALSASQTVPVG